MLQQNQGLSYWNGCRSVDDIVLPDGFSVSPATLPDFEASAPGLPFDFGCGGIYKMSSSAITAAAAAAAAAWRQHNNPFSDTLVNNVPVYKHEILKHGSHCHSREPSTGHLAPQNCSSGQAMTGASQPNPPSSTFYRSSPRPPLQLAPLPAPTLPSSHRQDPPLGTSPDWMNFMTSTSLQHLDETEPRFQYVLTASTSPAVKLDEESLTYLNQGQSYELKLKRLPNHCGERFTKSLIRVIFHERRLQFTEREQMELWKIAHPGERILDLDIPISYGLFNLRMDSNNVNCFEFTWDTELEAAVYIRINCISTEFTAKKHGGEKGVPFRIQVETYSASSSGGKEDQLVHCASCQVKVFKPKGADRKNKTDRDKIEKISDSEKDKYQPSFECTIFAEISPEQVHQYLDQRQKQHETGQLSGGQNIKEENQRPTSDNNSCLFRSVCGQTLADSSSRLSDIESPRDDVMASDTTGSRSLLESLSPSATSLQVSQWLQLNRFSNYAHTFQNFSGADILRLSREDLIELCGTVDGIRLNNALHVRRVRPCLTMHVLIQPLKRSCSIRDDSSLAVRGSCLNISSSSASRCWSPNSCNSPSSILSSLQSTSHPDLDQPCLSPLSPAARCTSSVQDVGKFHSFNSSSKRTIASDDDIEVEYSLVKRRCESNGKASCDFVFHAVHLEFLTKDNLLRCLANLFRLQYGCVSELCLQTSSGILVYISDSVVQNLPDMSRYVATATEDDRNSGFYRISLQTMYLTCSNFYENEAHTQPS